MKLWCLVAAAVALGQDLPAIKGTVVEYGSNAPIASAEVVLDEFTTVEGIYGRKIVTTAFTDSRGAFSIKPAHAGPHFIAVKKDSYLTPDELDKLRPPSSVHTEIPVTVAKEPSADLRFVLVRAASLTGRIVDDEDKPVRGIPVTVTAPGTPGQATVTTDADGVFTFPSLVPDPSVLRIGPEPFSRMVGRYTPEAMRESHEDFEVLSWPTGTPLPLTPGVTTNGGTIRIRKVVYYRARLQFDPPCDAGESIILEFPDAAGVTSTDCKADLLIDYLRPGALTLSVQSRSTKRTAWAVVPLLVDRENIEVKVAMRATVTVAGRIVSGSRQKLPVLGPSRVLLQSPASGLVVGLPGDVDDEGRFLITGATGIEARVQVEFGNSDLAVKELRYAAQPAPGGRIALAPGAELEIVLEDQPASLSGTAPDGYLVVLAPWPLTAVRIPKSARATSGAFRIVGLAAGEYVAAAISNVETDIDKALSNGQRITLARGEQRNVELKAK